MSLPSSSMSHAIDRAWGFILLGWVCTAVTPESVTVQEPWSRENPYPRLITFIGRHTK